MCTAAEDMHILHIFTHVQYLDFKLLCYTQKYFSKYITLQIITLKDCNFEAICNPHVTRNCLLAKICGRTLTKRGDVRST